MKSYKVVIMGGGGVGKSAITVRFVHSLFVEKYDPTIEDSYRKLINIDGIECTCEIIDTAGTEQFMAIHSLYIQQGDGFVLVFSLTSLESVNELQNIREQIHRIKEAESGKKVPVVLVGNKCDLFSERQVPREVAIGLSGAWGSTPYYETSARKEINIHELFDDLLRQMIKSRVGTVEKKKKKSKKCVLI